MENVTGTQKVGHAKSTEIKKGGAISAFPVQVGNKKGMKWKSRGRVEHDTIPIVDQKRQFWQLERAENDPVWSFYIMSGDIRLYVSHSSTDSNDRNITLEPADDCLNPRERYFKALLHPTGRVRLHSLSFPDKVIGIEDGILALLDPAGRPEEDIEWIVDTEIEKGDYQDSAFVRLKLKSEARWALSTGDIGDEVPVAGGSIRLLYYEWLWNGKSNSGTYKVPQTKLFITKDADNSSTGVILGNPSIANLKRFRRTSNPKISGDIYQSLADPKQYIGICADHLCLVDSKDEATGWDGKEITRMVFMIVGERVIYPPLPEDE